MDKRVEAEKPLTVQPNITLAQLKKQYSDETACKKLLADMRWPDGIECPRCGEKERVYTLSHKPFHYVCKSGKASTDDDGKQVTCHRRNGYRFSVLSRTIFENTNYPLSTWFEVIYLMTQSKKGISALQIHRQIGSGDYRTAWYMCMRIRGAMEDEDFPKLMGIVEIDETYVGGKEKNRHWNKRDKLRAMGRQDKMPVIGAISRKGSVVCKMIESADTRTLDSFVRNAVDRDRLELVATDENSSYRLLKEGGKGFALPHEMVHHGRGEYVRGIVHTNSIESFWSLIKRGVVGTYHKVSKKYLPMYRAEFQWRYNNRKDPDIFRKVLAGC